MIIYRLPLQSGRQRRYPTIVSTASLEFQEKGLSNSIADYSMMSGRHGDAKRSLNMPTVLMRPRLTVKSMKVTAGEMAKPEIKKVDRKFIRAMNRAASQIDAFHRQQIQHSWLHTRRPGTILGQLVNPVNAAGVYVPGARGGKTPLISTVLMTAIPAKIAGVEKLVMVTPSTRAGAESIPTCWRRPKRWGLMISTR